MWLSCLPSRVWLDYLIMKLSCLLWSHWSCSLAFLSFYKCMLNFFFSHFDLACIFLFLFLFSLLPVITSISQLTKRSQRIKFHSIALSLKVSTRHCFRSCEKKSQPVVYQGFLWCIHFGIFEFDVLKSKFIPFKFVPCRELTLKSKSEFGSEGCVHYLKVELCTMHHDCTTTALPVHTTFIDLDHTSRPWPSIKVAATSNSFNPNLSKGGRGCLMSPPCL